MEKKDALPSEKTIHAQIVLFMSLRNVEKIAFTNILFRLMSTNFHFCLKNETWLNKSLKSIWTINGFIKNEETFSWALV